MLMKLTILRGTFGTLLSGHLGDKCQPHSSVISELPDPKYSSGRSGDRFYIGWTILRPVDLASWSPSGLPEANASEDWIESGARRNSEEP